MVQRCPCYQYPRACFHDPLDSNDEAVLFTHASMSVLLETSLGDIVVDLLLDIAPRACENFLKLCALKCYNDCDFFRIEKTFVAQTGDPTNTGTSGFSIFSKCKNAGSKLFAPEYSVRASHARKGTVSMTSMEQRGGHGSQFFITLADGLEYLDGKHTPFGVVAEGLDVVDRIGSVYVDELFRPFRVIRIRHTIILHDPLDDPIGMPHVPLSPEPAQGGRDDRLGSDEEGEESGAADGDMRAVKLKRDEEAREARSRAEVLEMIGDIADADLKPPENVLFVCKLNPITEAEDLEIIFSRFGECKVDVLRDKVTKSSLCYGFVEFQTKEQCEKAYFKMDNAFIDDRRVRIDFSQSVSKIWNDARRGRIAKSTSGEKSTNYVKRRKLIDSVQEYSQKSGALNRNYSGTNPKVSPGLSELTSRRVQRHEHEELQRKRQGSRWDKRG